MMHRTTGGKLKLSRQLNGLVPLTVYHQNVRCLRGKANELLSQSYLTYPHILYLSEHHMNHLELQQTFFNNHKLGVSYSRTLSEKGGVCIFVQESLRYVRIDLESIVRINTFKYVPSRFISVLKVHA